MSDHDVMPQPSAVDFEPPPDELFFMPDDPFPDDLFADTLPEDLDYTREADPWFPVDELFDPDDVRPIQEAPSPADENWSWHDARLIGVERETEAGSRFEVGCIDLYANLHTGDLAGSYLPVAAFDDVEVATAFYNQLESQIHERALPADRVPGFAQEQAVAMNPEPENWRGSAPEEYAAYERLRDPEAAGIDGRDEPPPSAIDPLLRAAIELGGVVEPELEAAIEGAPAFRALSAIGVEADLFDPERNPPPFVDPETGTAYWIGVFQPDREDREQCVTSILSLGRNPETGELEAQLAPCVPGDWDRAYSAAERLIEIAQQGGIERCFDAAESMALATEQRELWETPLGVPLQPDTAREIAEGVRDDWEIDL